MRRVTLLVFAWLLLAGPAVSGLQSEAPVIAPAPPEASCARSIIACNTSLDGLIEEGDCKIASGSYADVYELQVPTKLSVTILMDSSDVDSYLVLREERALQPIRAWDNRPLPITVEDDNGGGGANSRVTATTDPAGLWIITARGKKRGSHGKYTLAVKCEDAR